MSKLFVDELVNGAGTGKPDFPNGFQLEGADFAPAVSGNVEFVATGAISNGDVVGVMPDGTVKTASTKISSYEDKEQFSLSGTVSFTQTVYIPTIDKVLVVYTESNTLYGVIGTISNGLITYNTPYIIRAATVYDVSLCYDSTNDKAVVLYHDANYASVRAKVLTVTATAISAGTESNLQQNGNSPLETCLVFDSTNGKVVAVWNWGTTMTARVLTVNGTSLSAGIALNFHTGSATDIPQGAFDSTNGKVLIVYEVGSQIRSSVGTVSGTSISFGSYVEVVPSAIGPTVAFDSINSKMILSYKADGKRKAVAGTISGTSITYGTELIVDDDNSTGEGSQASAFNPSTGATTLIYRDDVTGSTRAYAIDVKITTGTELELLTSRTQIDDNTSGTYWSAAYHSTEGVVVMSTRGPGNQGYGYVYDSSSSIDAYFGLSTDAYADGETGTFTIVGGINESQSGLKVGLTYYVQGNGTLGSFITTKKMGVALSATKLLIG